MEALAALPGVEVAQLQHGKLSIHEEYAEAVGRLSRRSWPLALSSPQGDGVGDGRSTWYTWFILPAAQRRYAHHPGRRHETGKPAGFFKLSRCGEKTACGTVHR